MRYVIPILSILFFSISSFFMGQDYGRKHPKIILVGIGTDDKNSKITSSRFELIGNKLYIYSNKIENSQFDGFIDYISPDWAKITK